MQIENDPIETEMSEIIKRLDSILVKNEMAVSDIIGKMNRAITDCNKESWERKYEAYQKIIETINEQSVRVAKQQMEIIANLKALKK